MTILIDGNWLDGAGPTLKSVDPADGSIVWCERASSKLQVSEAVGAARRAFFDWSNEDLSHREAIVRRFADLIEKRRTELSRLISKETGKLTWDADGEVSAMIAKVDISVKALLERAGSYSIPQKFGTSVLRHRPHGVMAVLGPYNFPGHLPNGHIVPALLAGNTIVFKPSEKTPAVGQFIACCWQDAGLSSGVFNLVQGGREVGGWLASSEIQGLLFTGSVEAGMHFRRIFVERPSVILALELGGNNPLVAWDSPDAAAAITIQSAFVTTGQRCSCARRLIVPDGTVGDAIIEAVSAAVDRIKIGAWSDSERCFMGPLIDEAAAKNAIGRADRLIARGARPIRQLEPVTGRSAAFLRPALFEVDPLQVPDEEIFAPLLQINRARDFDEAISLANATRFGLSAGLVSKDVTLWEKFRRSVRAGIVNWNRPTTGAASTMPFGGVGDSGNHRPSAYYAADYCAYPVASFEAPIPQIIIN